MYPQKSVFKPFLFVLLAASVLLASCAGNNASSAAGLVNTVGAVSTVTVTDQIQTSGNLDASQLVKLTWGVSGTVAQVNVKLGQKVKAGDVLAILKSDSVPSSIITAQSDLATAKRDLETLMDSKQVQAQAQLAIANAEQAVATAQTKVDSLTFPRASDTLIQNTQAKINQAKLQLAKASDAYRLVQHLYEGDPLKTQAELNLTNAQLNYNTQIATYNWYTGQASATDADLARANLAVAEANLADAQRQWGVVQNGPDPISLAAAQAKVDAAQAIVDQMEIVAPFDGQVIAVQSNPNDVITLGDAAVEVVNYGTLKVDTLVDETSISQVKMGDTAQITMDALPGVTFDGKVSLIDPIGTTVNGLVKYTVTIALDQTDKQVLFGATANVTIVTSDPRSMLAVPVGAVQTDTQGEYVALINSDGSLTRVAVQSGTLSGNVVTIAVTGKQSLKDGDQVQLGSTTTNQQNNGGGGGGNFRGPLGIGG